MVVSREEVIRIAGLAKLRLEPKEVDRLVVELNGILEHAEALADLDIDGVEPIESAAEGAAPLRSDELGPDLLRIPPSEIAPSWRDGFFVVPRLAAHDLEESEG